MLHHNGPRPPADGYRSWRLATLAGLFGLMWILSLLYFFGLARREVLLNGNEYVLLCAAPPLLVPRLLVSGELGGVLWGLGLIAAVAVPVWLVSRNPDSKLWYRLSVTSIVLLWLLVDLSLAWVL